MRTIDVVILRSAFSVVGARPNGSQSPFGVEDMVCGVAEQAVTDRVDASHTIVKAASVLWLGDSFFNTTLYAEAHDRTVRAAFRCVR